MMHLLGGTDSVLSNVVSELRDERIQQDSMRFRRNLQRLGEFEAFEISKALPYRECIVTTPLGESRMRTCDESAVVVASILRGCLMYLIGQAVLLYHVSENTVAIIVFELS